MDEKKIVLFDTFEEYMKNYTRVLCNRNDGTITKMIGEVFKDLASEEVSEAEFNIYYNSKLNEIKNAV